VFYHYTLSEPQEFSIVAILTGTREKRTPSIAKACTGENISARGDFVFCLNYTNTGWKLKKD